MKYEKPKCDDCNSELIYVSEITMDKVRKINKNGQISKKEDLRPWADNGIEFLRCPNFDCYNSYEVDYDDKDRIIKGEIIW